MIKSLTLHNFQSHIYTELDFVPGVNVILGSSDSGKTSIFRALNWLCTNRPTGESFRSHWGGDTIVDLVVGDVTLSRIRGKGKNVYECDGKTEKAIGTSVPDSITDILQLGDVNWQFQHSAPYLLDSSPGEVARVLNAAASLDQIDRTHSYIESKSRENNSQRVRIEHELKQVEISLSEKKERLTGVAGREKLLRSSFNSLCRTTKQKDTLKDLCKSLSVVQEERRTCEAVLKHTDRLNEASALEEEWRVVRSQLESMTDTIQKLADVSNKQGTLKQELTTLKKQWNKEMPKECPLCGK